MNGRSQPGHRRACTQKTSSGPPSAACSPPGGPWRHPSTAITERRPLAERSLLTHGLALVHGLDTRPPAPPIEWSFPFGEVPTWSAPCSSCGSTTPQLFVGTYAPQGNPVAPDCGGADQPSSAPPYAVVDREHHPPCSLTRALRCPLRHSPRDHWTQRRPRVRPLSVWSLGATSSAPMADGASLRAASWPAGNRRGATTIVVGEKIVHTASGKTPWGEIARRGAPDQLWPDHASWHRWLLAW